MIDLIKTIFIVFTAMSVALLMLTLLLYALSFVFGRRRGRKKKSA